MTGTVTRIPLDFARARRLFVAALEPEAERAGVSVDALVAAVEPGWLAITAAGLAATTPEERAGAVTEAAISNLILLGILLVQQRALTRAFALAAGLTLPPPGAPPIDPPAPGAA